MICCRANDVIPCVSGIFIPDFQIANVYEDSQDYTHHYKCVRPQWNWYSGHADVHVPTAVRWTVTRSKCLYRRITPQYEPKKQSFGAWMWTSQVPK
jgi:hypothetical protein